MRPSSRNKRPRSAAANPAAPLDPVALTLAVWLGLIAGVTGMVRLAQNAMAEARYAQPYTQSGQPRPTPAEAVRPLLPLTTAPLPIPGD